MKKILHFSVLEIEQEYFLGGEKKVICEIIETKDIMR